MQDCFALMGRRMALAALILSALVGTAHAADAGISDNEIVLGMSLSLQAGKNSYGVAAAQGMKLYFDEVNRTGGVRGRKIVQRILDDDAKPTNSEANARKLIDEGAFILFGAIDGGPSTAITKVAKERNVPFFGPLAGPPILRQPFQPMVFPVRAEHKDEFRALAGWGKTTGLKTIGFLHADTDVGRTHLENVRLAAKEFGMEVTLAIPFKGDVTDAQIDAMANSIAEKKPDLFMNHGATTLYEKLITKTKAKTKTVDARSATTFMAVNSGSSQIAKGLGPLATGMVFSQVVPNPRERKYAISREYQDAVRKASPNAELSYGALEGYMTAKVLVMALKSIPPQDLSRKSLVKALYSGPFDVGGFPVSFAPEKHEGSHFVDLSIVATDGRFMH